MQIVKEREEILLTILESIYETQKVNIWSVNNKTNSSLRKLMKVNKKVSLRITYS